VKKREGGEGDEEEEEEEEEGEGEEEEEEERGALGQADGKAGAANVGT
jgi:hypothetical protein